ncbi:histidine kinase [Streptomyces sp. NBC_01381]|uniref:sensor histidine kinase n=1 Tax=Streptomyces sp. NBC_01381 TaxID=2903845 RepID=UPI002B1D8688|nr:histidine kinase [Streptomyces sp. NBC_01381]
MRTRMRGVARHPRTPVAAAALLSLAATAELLLRANADVPLPFTLSLALGTTVPVAALAGGAARGRGGGRFVRGGRIGGVRAGAASEGIRPAPSGPGTPASAAGERPRPTPSGPAAPPARTPGPPSDVHAERGSPAALPGAPAPPSDVHSAAIGSPRNTSLAALPASAAAMLALAPFHVLTIAGLCALLVALHQAGRHGPRLLTVLLALPFVAYAVTAAAADGAGERVMTVLVAVCAGVAAGTGIARGARDTALVNGAAERAIAETLQEHAARGERARIARELHDVVAHHISMIAVQAETARLTTPGLPTAGAERFLAIGDTARTALTEMRRLLGVLREDAGPAVPDRRPQPGLEQLGELVDEARDASAAAVRLIVEGPVRTLDPGVELTAYRIVQEALTNARRHAPGAAVDVELHYTQGALRLRVRDNGPSPDDLDGLDDGHGLLGMRERAAMVGGELRAGPARRGGFLIEATFPAPVREHAA